MDKPVFYYSEPVHIANFMDKKMIVNYLKTTANMIEKVSRTHSEFGVITVTKNEDYGFLMVDYGLMIRAFQDYVKMACKTFGNPDGEKYAKMIGVDFLTNKDENLAKNGRLFVNLLSYYGVSFMRKNAKSFYSRTLIKNTKTGSFTLVNSIGINLKEFKQMLGTAIYERQIDNVLLESEAKVVATDARINNVLIALEGTAEVAHFWSRDDGLNHKIFE